MFGYGFWLILAQYTMGAGRCLVILLHMAREKIRGVFVEKAVEKAKTHWHFNANGSFVLYGKLSTCVVDSVRCGENQLRDGHNLACFDI